MRPWGILLLGAVVFSFGMERCLAEKVPDSAKAVQPLAIGTAVPDVTLTTPDGAPFVPADEAAKQPLAVIFYRGGWCPFCTRHLRELSEIEEPLRAMGVRIVAISPDRPAILRENLENEKRTYTLLSDSSMAAAKAFGIAFRVDDATVEKYRGYGIDLEEASGKSHHLLPVPAVFIVGMDGTVKFAYANADYKVRLSAGALLDAARKAVKP